MADRFYSVVLGEGLAHQVTEGSSTSSEAIELRVSDSIYASKLAVIIGVDAIKQYLETTETTPIA
jgi:hypothetical protein